MKKTFNFAVLMAAVLWIGGCEYSTAPASKGGRGESCLARNDCGGGLSCIGGTCVDSDVPINVATKQCDVVQCTKKSDCCASDEKCRCVDDVCEPVFECTDDFDCIGTPFQVCVGSTCVDCADDADCFGGDSCMGNVCVECSGDADCDSDESCVEGQCIPGCKRDEECGPLQQCQDAECIDKDCESDRECVAAMDNQRATCKDDGQCTVECEADAECNLGGFSFSKCDDGECKFLGCETNADCRALLGGGTNMLAICREEQD